MEYTKAWQNFLNEGGLKSTKTDARLTPDLVVRAIDVYKRTLADFNNWLENENQLPVRAVRPVGSVSYAQRDLQDGTDIVYGDVDYLVEFPPPPSTGESYTDTRKEENARKREYRKLFTNFLNSEAVTGEVDVYETLAENADPFMVILEAHPGLLVQVDTIVTFPDYAEWISARYTPERGVKGYTMGKLYKALGDIFPLTIGTEGVLALTLELNGHMRASDLLSKVLVNYEEGLEEHRERTTKRIEKKISQLQDSSHRDKLLKKIKEISEINEKALEAVSPDLRV